MSREGAHREQRARDEVPDQRDQPRRCPAHQREREDQERERGSRLAVLMLLVHIGVARPAIAVDSRCGLCACSINTAEYDPSPKVNLHHAVDITAKCDAHLATSRSQIQTNETLALHRVIGGCASGRGTPHAAHAPSCAWT